MMARGIATPITPIPATTYGSPRMMTEIDKVNAFGQVVERDLVGTTRLAAPSPKVMQGGWAPVVSTTGVGVSEVDRVNAFGQVVERDLVVNESIIPKNGRAKIVSGGIAEIERLNPVMEVDKVNAFGQVVERDLYAGGGVNRMISAPASVITSPRVLPASSIPATRGFAEVDKVNAFGQVVERDFVSSPMRMISAPTPVVTAAPTISTTTRSAIAPAVVTATPTMASSVVTTSPMVTAAPVVTAAVPATRALTTTTPRMLGGVTTEVDRVNAFGQVVERDFVGTTRIGSPVRAAQVV